MEKDKNIFTEEFLNYLKSITAKRAKTVIDHILEHGFITSEELKDNYNYDHPPRAVRDVRELGIPIETFRVKDKKGRSIGAYKFGNPDKLMVSKSSGRTILSKELKDHLINKHGSQCFIYLEAMNENDLQIDHRIPYEVIGESSKTLNPDDFMLLSGSANRAKSWSCEHCKNCLELKKLEVCRNCYWAFPENYQHIAMNDIRRVDILWKGEEISQYNKFKQLSDKEKISVQDLIKKIINKLE
ncbi:MAG: HNH endonuclease [Cyanobacteriota bacterium]